MQYRQTRIDQLTHELSVIKRQQFGKRSEQLNTEQMSLLDEAIDTDLAAIEPELEQLQPDTPERKSRQQPDARRLARYEPPREPLSLEIAEFMKQFELAAAPPVFWDTDLG